MFNKNVYTALQLLNHCLKQMEMICKREQGQKIIDMNLTQLLHDLRTVQTSLSQSLSQSMRLFAKISTKIKNQTSQQTEEFRIQDFSFEQLDNFIDQALALRKLHQMPSYTEESEIQLNQSAFIKFPALQKEINHRRQSMRQIQQINHNLQTLELKLRLSSGREDKTLHSILKRLQNINFSIIQSQSNLDTQDKHVPLTDYVRQHNQAHNILKLIFQGNVCFLEEILKKMESSETKSVVYKIAEQMKKCDKNVQTIYDFLQYIGLANKQVSHRFLKTINYFTLSQKLTQCVKLVTYLKNIQALSLPIQISSSADVEMIEKQEGKRQSTRQARQVAQKEENYFEQQMQLLKSEETIYELEQQLKELQQKIQKLQNQKQNNITQISKLHQQKILLKAQNQNLKVQNQNLIQKQSQLTDQYQKLGQIIQHLQVQNNQVREQLRKAKDQKEIQVKKNQLLLQQNWQQQATLQQQKALIQQINEKLQTTLSELTQQQLINQNREHQKHANQRLIEELKQTIQALIQKQHKQDKSLDYVYAVTNYCIEPTQNYQFHNQMEARNIAESHFEESLSQTTSNIEQQSKGKLNIRHSKSFSVYNNNEFMSWNLSKKEQQPHSNQSQQTSRITSDKDKIIKRYEIFINRYKTQIKKHLKKNLELEANVKKLELQLLHLNQIVEQQNIHKQLLSIQEEPSDIHKLDISEQALEQSNIEKLTEKEAELRVKEQSINFKIQGIINTVLQLNAFKTETKQSTQTSIVDDELYELGLDSFNPQSRS